MFSLARSLASAQQTEVAVSRSDTKRGQSEPSVSVLTSSSRYARTRPSDPSGSRSADAWVALGGNASNDSTGRRSFGGEKEALPPRRRNEGSQQQRAHGSSTSQRSPLHVGTAQLSSASATPLPAAPSPSGFFSKLPGRKKKQQQLQVAMPPRPDFANEASGSSAHYSPNRMSILDHSSNAIGAVPVASPSNGGTPPSSTPAPVAARRTPSIFRRPKTAETAAHSQHTHSASGHGLRVQQPHEASPATTDRVNSSFYDPSADSPLADTIRPLKRLLGARSVSSNALKDMYRRQDPSLPIPTLPSKQAGSSSGHRSSSTPRSPRNSAHGLTTRVDAQEDVPFAAEGNHAMVSGPPSSSRLHGVPIRGSASPLVPGLPASRQEASLPLDALSPSADSTFTSRGHATASGSPDPRSRGPTLASENKASSPEHLSTAGNVGPARIAQGSLMSSASRSSLAGSGKESAAPFALRRRGSSSQGQAASPPLSAENQGGYFAPHEAPMTRRPSSSSRRRGPHQQGREGPEAAGGSTAAASPLPIPAPAGWTVAPFSQSPLPSPSIITGDAQSGSSYPASRYGAPTPAGATPPAGRRNSTSRHSTTEFPTLAHATDGTQREGLPLMSPSELLSPTLTEAVARTYVPPPQHKRYPPRATESSFMRKRFGSSSSIGFGLGIISPGGTKGSVGPTDSSSAAASLAGSPRSSFSYSFAPGQMGQETPQQQQYGASFPSPRHTSDVGLTSASRQAAAAAAAAGGGAASGAALGSRKASFSSVVGAASTPKSGATNTAALLSNGNVGGGSSASVLGNTRQRTSSLFASLTSPFVGMAGKDGAASSISASPSSRSQVAGRGGAGGPASSSGTSRMSLDGPGSRTRSQSAVDLELSPTTVKVERNGPSRRPSKVDRPTELTNPDAKSDEGSLRQAFASTAGPANDEAIADKEEVKAAAAAAVDAIKARDNEAQEDIRYFLLGESKPAGAKSLKHAKSEERLGQRRPRKASTSSEAYLPRSASQSRPASRSGRHREDVPPAPRRGHTVQPLATVQRSRSSTSLPGLGDAIGDLSENSDMSLQVPGSTPWTSVSRVSPQEKTEESQVEDIDLWAEAEAPRLLAMLSKTMLRADIVKFLASTSTLKYPVAVQDATAASSGDAPAEASPLAPERASAIRREALKLFMRRFPFGSDPLDIALRRLLMDIKLPSETQQIDRVMEAFARRYMECNEGIYTSEDEPYILAFSLMMLHTDAFNRNAKHKMSKADYVKNTSTSGVPTEILEYFFDNTTFTQFIHVDEETDMAVAALPTGGPPTANVSAAPSLHNSRSASSASLAGLGQGSMAMSMANTSDLLLGSLTPGGNLATASFGSLIASAGGATHFPNSSSTMLAGGSGSRTKIDPYLLIAQGTLGECRPYLEHLIPTQTPYSVFGTAPEFDSGRIRRTFVHAPLLEIVQQRRPAAGAGWNNNDLPGGTSSVQDHLEAVATIKVPKAGIVLRKDDIPLAPPIGSAGGEPAKMAKKAHGKKWKKWGLVLSGSQALFFKDFVWTSALESQMEEQVGEWWTDPDLVPRSMSDFVDEEQSITTSAPADAILRKRSFTISPRVSYFKPDTVIPLSDAVAVRDDGHAANGEWIFRFWFRYNVQQGGQVDSSTWESRHFLLQAATEQDMNDWIALINYCAAYRSVGDRRLDVQQLGTILCESGARPSDSEDEVFSANDLRRTDSALRRHGADGSQMHVISSSTTSNVIRSTSGRDGTAADQAGGCLISPQATMESFVAQAKAGLDESTKLLDEELRTARHFSMLTPFQRATRERIEVAAIPVAERIRERRLQVAKWTSRFEVLSRDLEHVNHVAPSWMVFIPNAGLRSAPSFDGVNGEADLGRTSGGDGISHENSQPMANYEQAEDDPHAGDSSEMLRRVDSTPPQLDLSMSFTSQLDLFGSNGQRTSGSQGSLAAAMGNASGRAPVGSSRFGQDHVNDAQHGQRLQGLDLFEELTPVIRSHDDDREQLSTPGHLQDRDRTLGSSSQALNNARLCPGEQAEEWSKTAAAKRVSLVQLPDGLDPAMHPPPHRQAGPSTSTLTSSSSSNSSSGPLSVLGTAIGAMKRKASLNRHRPVAD